MYEFTKEEIETITQALETAIAVYGLAPKSTKEETRIRKLKNIKNFIKGDELKSVIVTVNIEIQTPYTTEAEAINYALHDYSLPMNVVKRDLFEIVKVINTND